MKRIVLLLILEVIVFLLTSCDCVVHHEGYVLDGETERPIAGATIKFDRRKFKTDSHYLQVRLRKALNNDKISDRH